MAINVLQELRELKVFASDEDLEFEGDAHIRIKCPFHNDTNVPNMSVRIVEEPEGPLGHAKCFACSVSVPFPQLLHKYLQAEGSKKTIQDVQLYLNKKYGLFGDDAAISPLVIDKWATQIWEAKPLLRELYDRALDDATIKKHRLGVEGSKITIPVFNEAGRCVNVQRYAPGATTRKFVNTKGRGKLRLYPFDQLEYDTIIITGGPIKALAGTRYYNPNNIGVVSAVGGEHEWSKEFNEHLMGKTIYIALDVDNAGVTAAKKRASQVYPVAEVVSIVTLPFVDKELFAKGGLDDFLFAHADLYMSALEGAVPYDPPAVTQLDETEEPTHLKVGEAFNPEYVGKRVSMDVNVVGVCDTPYYLPKDFEITCTRDTPFCALCPVSKVPEGDVFEHTINPESSSFLGLVDKPTNQQSRILASDCGVPLGCKKFACKATTYQSVEDIRISPKLELHDRSTERTNQPALVLGEVEANSDYKITGRMYPHPDTQKATLVCSKAEALSDDVSNWVLEEDLSVFQPEEWTLPSLTRRLDELYAYMGNEISHIYRRPDMHLLMDLAYHSPLFFTLKGRIQNGWTQVLVLGDSGQGKTEASKALMELYQLGVRVDCKNATVAGLLGGNTQLGDNKKFFIKWGFIPTNDGKLVFLEELGGTKIEVIGACTDMRSEGVAQIPKIEAKTTKARTRLVANSNSRSGRTLMTYTYGVDAILELVGHPPDVRRFDAAICLSESTNDIRPSEQSYGKIPTKEQFRSAVLFAWTRTHEHVCLDEVGDLLKTRAKEMCSYYVEDKIPLVNSGSMHFKIAKLASALAVRTGSIQGEEVIVRECHVEYVVEFLNRLYKDPAMGYDKYSEAVRAMNNISNPDFVKIELEKIPHIVSLREHMRKVKFLEKQDVVDWGGIDAEDARILCSVLVRNSCVVRKKGAYLITTGFKKFLDETELTPNFGTNPMNPEDRF